MTSYQIIEFLESLPKQGMIEVDRSEGGEFYFTASSASYEAAGDDALKITADLGYGTLATIQSIVLVDCDRITAIRHTRGSHE